MRSTAQLPCAYMTKKNDKYALNAKRRIRVNGHGLTVSPYSSNSESNDLRDRAKMIEKLRKSNDPEDKKVLSDLLESYDQRHTNKVEKSVMKRKGFI